MGTSDGVRRKLERKFGRVWTEQEVAQEFDVLGHTPPHTAVVVRLSDSRIGTMVYDLDGVKLYAGFESDLCERKL